MSDSTIKVTFKTFTGANQMRNKITTEVFEIALAIVKYVKENGGMDIDFAEHKKIHPAVAREANKFGRDIAQLFDDTSAD